MAEWDYSWDYGGEQPYDDWSWDGGNMGAYSSPDYMQSPAYQQFTGWGDPTGVGSSGDTSFSGEGSGGFFGGLGSVLGSIGGFLGQNAGVIGPLAGAAGSIAGGAIGSNAANDAARLQADALNRGIDLQTAQWLQQQQNLAPYLQAGQGGLAQLQQLAGREQPALPGAAPAVRSADYNASLPNLMPGWRPQAYQGPDALNAQSYRWNPQQGPQAQDYRYTPGQTPDAAAYQWTPGQAPSAAQYRYTPGAVPTLSGKELLANDPGVQFRMDEGRKALEASAAARGGLLSGPTLAALQRQGQELGSQEYAQAWNRASQQAQLREQWGQRASELGFGQSAEEARLREAWAQQASQQGFGQAEAASRLREQVNQVASQQGWTQAQAEAVFREQQAQLASQQGWNQALGGQQNQFTQGLETSRYNQGQQQSFTDEIYKRMLAQNQLLYGRDVTQNTTDYDRQQALYKQQLGQHLLPWEQQSTLANLGGQAVGMYGNQGQSAANSIATLLGRQGEAQAGGATNQANSWMNALQNVGGAATNYTNNLGYQQGIQAVLSGLNR